MKRKSSQTTLAAQNIQKCIYVFRGHRVILDQDLAALYKVSTKRLNEQVRRNLKRFPEDFLFRLTPKEVMEWLRSRSQNATLKRGKNIKYLPYAFTEYGALMAANVLNSERAVVMSTYIIRAFVRLREVFLVNQILEKRLSEIEKILLGHDVGIQDLYQKIRPLLLPANSLTRVPRRCPEEEKHEKVYFSSRNCIHRNCRFCYPSQRGSQGR